jgi:Iap family predicted aminopeptidase
VGCATVIHSGKLICHQHEGLIAHVYVPVNEGEHFATRTGVGQTLSNAVTEEARMGTHFTGNRRGLPNNEVSKNRRHIIWNEQSRYAAYSAVFMELRSMNDS